MVLMDTARADHFEPYGAAAGSTPVIAGLARAGVSTTAYAPANWTIPSHAALFTGQLPRSLGLGQVGGGFHGAVANRLQPHADSTLAAVLRRHGVATRAVSANLWVSEQAGFGAGFDEFVNIVIPRQPRTSQSLRDRMGWYLDALLARIDDGARAIDEILARWIAEARTKPFF